MCPTQGKGPGATQLNKMLTIQDMVPGWLQVCKGQDREVALPYVVCRGIHGSHPRSPNCMGKSGASGSGLPCWTPKGLPFQQSQRWP